MLNGKKNTGNKDLRILGFLQKIALTEKGVSATLALLDRHLKARGVVEQIFDVEVYGLRDKINTIRNFDSNFSKWSLKKSLDVRIKRQRSKIAEKKVKFIEGNYNACLQIGSEFSLNNIGNLKNIPKFSYHDNNLMALVKSSRPNQNMNSLINDVFDFEKNVYDELDGIFTMTEFVRDSFIEDFGVPNDKVHCVGFGTNIKTENFARDYDCETILFVAKDSFEKKGGKVLLEAFKKVKKARNNARLILVGQELNVDIDGVEVHGFIDKRIAGEEERLKSFFKKSSLFVMPSFDEAAGNVFIEAMAHKIPCIGASRGSTPEIIVGNRCGCVIEPGNHDELADNILSLLDDKNTLIEMGRNGFSAVSTKYNWDVVCGKVINVMKQFI